MKAYVLAALAIGAPLAANSLTAADAAKKEYEKFQGTWRFVSIEIEGEKTPEASFKGSRLIIHGRDFQVNEGGVTFGGTFDLNVDTKPKRIDIRFTSGPEKGQTLVGIYELDGDTYRVCMSMTGKDRPKDFASKAGSRHVLEVLKREKKVSRAGAVREQRKRLEGTWQAVSYALDGQEASVEDMKRFQLIIDTAGKTTAVQDGKPFIASTTKIDPTADPKTMDITFTLGPDKGRTALAIYKLEGDTMTICRAAPGKDRPTKFSSKPGSGHTLMVYARRTKDASAGK
jgi:uncharacterized protein (TIGR03067 family)